jgi:putative Mn2+ efflux pump MntP
MGWFEVVLVAVGLAMDAFAVSLAAGTSKTCRGPRPTFRLSFHFGLFQALMPVIGWYLGTRVAVLMGAVDHWIAFGLLAFVGVRMIRSGFDKREDVKKPDPSKGWTLVTLSLATSIDALAVGLSLAMLEVSIWYPSVVIGVITAGLSVLGVRLGSKLGAVFGRRMEVVGGVILIGIGLKILIDEAIG